MPARDRGLSPDGPLPTTRRPSRVAAAALQQGPVSAPSGRPAPLRSRCGCPCGVAPMTPINILVGIHLAMILCLLLLLGD